jgi:hypothetical protein
VSQPLIPTGERSELQTHRDNGQRFIVRPGLPGAPDPLGPPNGRDGSKDDGSKDDDGGRRSTVCRSSRRSCTETTSRMDIARMRLTSPQRRKLGKHEFCLHAKLSIAANAQRGWGLYAVF